MTGQIWKNRQKTSWGDIGYCVLFAFIFIMVIGTFGEYMKGKAVCSGYVTIKVVDTQNGREVAIDKLVCTEWVKP